MVYVPIQRYKSMENLSEVKKAVDSVPPEGKAKAKTIVKAEASGGKSPAKAGGKGGGQVSSIKPLISVSLLSYTTLK